MRQSIAARMTQIPGLAESALLIRLAGLTHAMRSVVVPTLGGDHQVIEVPDERVSLSAVREALVLHNVYPARQIDISGQIRVEQLHELSERMAKALTKAELRELAGLTVEGEFQVLPPEEEDADGLANVRGITEGVRGAADGPRSVDEEGGAGAAPDAGRAEPSPRDP